MKSLNWFALRRASFIDLLAPDSEGTELGFTGTGGVGVDGPCTASVCQDEVVEDLKQRNRPWSGLFDGYVEACLPVALA